ncbi:hypothetical protein L6452_08196 [Arctium lappa]|uniref:Uncharacterized protein n=1 Tax=Arctium lappa TaxID=4217 RepID=A0ACB9DGW6_ARCLA|nr:hypothetical protein L6452_08196 [Arctium lappa]
MVGNKKRRMTVEDTAATAVMVAVVMENLMGKWAFVESQKPSANPFRFSLNFRSFPSGGCCSRRRLDHSLSLSLLQNPK